MTPPTHFGLFITNMNQERYITAIYTVAEASEGFMAGTATQVLGPGQQGALNLLFEVPNATWSFRFSTDEEIAAWLEVEKLACAVTEGSA